MEDYPKTLTEFETRFSTEEDCRRYLLELRWPEGFVCPRCGGHEAWTTERELMVCTACGYHASVTTGTIFEKTHKPLTLWFRAIWWLTALKTGASALGLQRVLGLKSYKTAWTWLHKLRRAMVRPGRDRLSGRVQVDETYIGAEEKGVRGRGTESKALVVVAAQENGKRVGRIRMRRVQDASAASLHPFVEDTIEPGSVVHTDGWEGYVGLEKKGYHHEITVLAKHKEPASELLPHVHHVVALLKNWMAGTLHDGVSHEHLDYYLDEFTFRFNRRTSGSRGKLFYRLMQHAVQVGPAPYKTMVKHVREHRKADHNIWY